MCADHPPHAASAVEVPVRQERTRIPGRPRCSPRDLSERTTCDRQSSPAFGGERRWIGTPTEREPGDVGSNSGDSPPDLQSSSDESDSGMPDESTVATRRIRSHRGVVLTEVLCSPRCCAHRGAVLPIHLDLHRPSQHDARARG